LNTGTAAAAAGRYQTALLPIHQRAGSETGRVHTRLRESFVVTGCWAPHLQTSQPLQTSQWRCSGPAAWPRHRLAAPPGSCLRSPERRVLAPEPGGQTAAVR
jgi:hypothetical protein